MSNRAAILAGSDYEPYEHRTRPGSTTNNVALMHLIKGFIGTGILAMPEAFKNAGLIFGFVASIIITALCTLSLHILFKNMYFFCKRDKIPQITYPDTFKESLKMGPNFLRPYADAAGGLVNIIIVIYQQGVLCVYLIFVATNVKQVVDIHTPENQHLSKETYLLLMLIFCASLTLIKNLAMLGPISNLGNWITITGLCCIYKFIFVDLDPITCRDLIAPVRTIPLFMGTSMFAVLSIGAILTVENNMKDGRNFGGTYGVLNKGMVFCTILNIITGFFGYWKYGEETEGSITLNIDIQETLAQVIRILFAVSIAFSYPLNCFPMHEILWDHYSVKFMTTSKHQLMWNYCLRMIYVLISFILAMMIPRLGLFISLLGAFGLSGLGLIFPPLIDICTRWPDEFGKNKWILYRNIGLMLFGLSGFIFGTHAAIDGIVKSFEH